MACMCTHLRSCDMHTSCIVSKESKGEASWQPTGRHSRIRSRSCMQGLLRVTHGLACSNTVPCNTREPLVLTKHVAGSPGDKPQQPAQHTNMHHAAAAHACHSSQRSSQIASLAVVFCQQPPFRNEQHVQAGAVAAQCESNTRLEETAHPPYPVHVDTRTAAAAALLPPSRQKRTQLPALFVSAGSNAAPGVPYY